MQLYTISTTNLSSYVHDLQRSMIKIGYFHTLCFKMTSLNVSNVSKQENGRATDSTLNIVSQVQLLVKGMTRRTE